MIIEIIVNSTLHITDFLLIEISMFNPMNVSEYKDLMTNMALVMKSKDEEIEQLLFQLKHIYHGIDNKSIL